MQRTLLKSIHFTNFLIPLENLIIKETLWLAKNLQAKLLEELKNKYGDELSQGHQPSFLDPYKTIHMKKVELARNMKAACLKPLATLTDVGYFINLFRDGQNKNMKISPNLGKRLEMIFGKFQHDINELEEKHLNVSNSIEQIHEIMLSILRSIKAFTSIDNPNMVINGNVSLNLIQQYYVEQIAGFKQDLITKYQEALTMIKAEKSAANEYAANQVKRFFDEMQLALEEVAESENLSVLDKSFVRLKRSFLDVQMLPYITHRFSVEKNSPASYTFETLLQAFAGYLKFEEKNFLWGAHQDLVNDPNARLKSLNPDRQKAWYLSAILEKNIEDPVQSKAQPTRLQQEKDREDQDAQDDKDIAEAMKSVGMIYAPKKKPKAVYEIKKENILERDFTDPFHTNKLMRNLNEVFFMVEDITSQELNRALDEALQNHFDKYLNYINFDNALFDILENWKKHLTNWLDSLKRELVNAEKLLGRNSSTEEKISHVTQEAVHESLKLVQAANARKAEIPPAPVLETPEKTPEMRCQF